MKKGLSIHVQAPKHTPKSKKQVVFCSNGLHPDVYYDPNEMVSTLMNRIMELEAQVEFYKANSKGCDYLTERLQYYKDKHKNDVKVIRELKAKIKELKEERESFKVPKKDSHNSSIPPSKEDIASSEKRKRTRSLRQQSGKKTGGQPEHEGCTLGRKEKIAETIDIPLNVCPNCASDLSAVPIARKFSRQVIDIEIQQPKVILYSILEKTCPFCGKVVRSKFPKNVKGTVSYGPTLQALVVYLAEEHAVSYERIQSFLRDLFLINLSQGTIDNIIKRMTGQARELYEKIKEKIEGSSVVGADETGIDIKGVMHWLWVWQTETASYFATHKKRGFAAIEEMFPDGLPNATLVTDRHGAYFQMKVKNRQICLVHLLRNFVFLIEKMPKAQWSKDMRQLIVDAIKQYHERPWEEIDREGLKKRLDELLETPLGTDDKDFVRMRNALASKKDFIFSFLDSPDIPFDNNASERAIRPTKTKLKVAGLFRSKAGAESYAIIHSVLDTAKKQGVSLFNELQAIAQKQPSSLTL